MALCHTWTCCGKTQYNNSQSTECQVTKEAFMNLIRESAAREAEERNARDARERSARETEERNAREARERLAREAQERYTREAQERSARERAARATENRQRATDNASTPEAPEEYKCPILFNVMIDPVIAADGFSYERSAIERWLMSHNTSPKTNAQLESRHLIPNRNLKILIEEWKISNGIS